MKIGPRTRANKFGHVAAQAKQPSPNNACRILQPTIQNKFLHWVAARLLVQSGNKFPNFLP